MPLPDILKGTKLVTTTFETESSSGAWLRNGAAPAAFGPIETLGRGNRGGSELIMLSRKAASGGYRSSRRRPCYRLLCCQRRVRVWIHHIGRLWCHFAGQNITKADRVLEEFRAC